jgi:hypothetical protein
MKHENKVKDMNAKRQVFIVGINHLQEFVAALRNYNALVNKDIMFTRKPAKAEGRRGLTWY